MFIDVKLFKYYSGGRTNRGGCSNRGSTVYRPLNRTSYRIVQVAAASCLAQEFQIVWARSICVYTVPRLLFSLKHSRTAKQRKKSIHCSWFALTHIQQPYRSLLYRNSGARRVRACECWQIKAINVDGFVLASCIVAFKFILDFEILQ